MFFSQYHNTNLIVRQHFESHDGGLISQTAMV